MFSLSECLKRKKDKYLFPHFCTHIWVGFESLIFLINMMSYLFNLSYLFFSFLSYLSYQSYLSNLSKLPYLFHLSFVSEQRNNKYIFHHFCTHTLYLSGLWNALIIDQYNILLVLLILLFFLVSLVFHVWIERKKNICFVISLHIFEWALEGLNYRSIQFLTHLTCLTCLTCLSCLKKKKDKYLFHNSCTNVWVGFERLKFLIDKMFFFLVPFLS